MGAIKAVKMNLLLGQSIQIETIPGKWDIRSLCICSSWNHFFSELHKSHTQSPLVPFLGPCFLLSSLGIDFSLHIFDYSNMTFDPQIGDSVNNLFQWDSCTQHHPIKDGVSEDPQGVKRKVIFFPGFIPGYYFTLFLSHRNFVKIIF